MTGNTHSHTQRKHCYLTLLKPTALFSFVIWVKHPNTGPEERFDGRSDRFHLSDTWRLLPSDMSSSSNSRGGSCGGPWSFSSEKPIFLWGMSWPRLPAFSPLEPANATGTDDRLLLSNQQDGLMFVTMTQTDWWSRDTLMLLEWRWMDIVYLINEVTICVCLQAMTAQSLYTGNTRLLQWKSLSLQS